MSASPVERDLSALSLFVIHSYAASLIAYGVPASDTTVFATSTTFFLRYAVDKNIPYPYSALSSNNEFAHAGPCPFLSTVYGHHGADPPQIDEQPVAFATIIRSPNNCVINLMYGVSPHPPHAPENSNNG